MTSFDASPPRREQFPDDEFSDTMEFVADVITASVIMLVTAILMAILLLVVDETAIYLFKDYDLSVLVSALTAEVVISYMVVRTFVKPLHSNDRECLRVPKRLRRVLVWASPITFAVGVVLGVLSIMSVLTVAFFFGLLPRIKHW